MLNTYINKVINSAVFAKSKRQRELLSYLIQQMRSGNSLRVKGYVIALEVFKRSESFDPSKDAIVRVEAGRLRNKLREYYETLGSNDPVEIILPKGSYAIQVIDRVNDNHSHNSKKPNRLLSPPKLAIMPFSMIDICSQDEYLVDEITNLFIFELVELDIVQVTSRKTFLFFNVSKNLSRKKSRHLGADYMLEGTIQKSKKSLILLVRIYSQLEDAYVWHFRLLFNAEEKIKAIQLIAKEVNKFLLDDLPANNMHSFNLKEKIKQKVNQ
jgi:TolB-like protein